MCSIDPDSQYTNSIVSHVEQNQDSVSIHSIDYCEYDYK